LEYYFERRKNDSISAQILRGFEGIKVNEFQNVFRRFDRKFVGNVGSDKTQRAVFGDRNRYGFIGYMDIEWNGFSIKFVVG
jgi:hypothetical protein